jgi:hypothetical protein
MKGHRRYNILEKWRFQKGSLVFRKALQLIRKTPNYPAAETLFVFLSVLMSR